MGNETALQLGRPWLHATYWMRCSFCAALLFGHDYYDGPLEPGSWVWWETHERIPEGVPPEGAWVVAGHRGIKVIRCNSCGGCAPKKVTNDDPHSFR